MKHIVPIAASAALCGCEGVQSALAPAWPVAREIASLWWWMAAMAGGVFALVLALVLYAVLRDPARRWNVGAERLIVAGGIALPVAVLSVLLPFGIRVGSGVTAANTPDTVQIRVRGHQWWWHIEYRDGTAAGAFETANELYVPTGRPVELTLTSADVVHSLWIPRLAGKLDLIPGRTNRLVIQADEPGVFRGQCAEFCGIGHAKMAFQVVAVPPAQFTAWARRLQAPARLPGDAVTRQGAQHFAAAGCGLCHAVRGHGAWGRTGPDLTHVGSRLTIGAGLLDNTRANLALWIVDNDTLKPGNRMPDFVELEPEARESISAYLESLQ